MNKRALLLTAATAALLSGPAFAQSCQIDSKVTTPQDTATCNGNGTGGTITIGTDGSVVINTNPWVAPAITIDGDGMGGAADVINQGTISYIGVGDSTTPLIGIDMVGGFTGGLDNAAGTIDFTGAGSNKTGILISNATGTEIFNGDITQTQGGTLLTDLFGGIQSWKFDAPNAAAILLETGSVLKIQGDSSVGIDIASGSTLGTAGGPLSDIDIFGSITMTPSSSSSSASQSYGIEIAGTMNGNINIAPGGTIAVQGNGGSAGIYIQAPGTNNSPPGGVLNGDINIDGTISITPISATGLTPTNDTGVFIGGTLAGSLNIGTEGQISSSGEGAQGVVITGTLGGAIDNQGTIDALGTTAAKGNIGNPQALTALAVEGSVNGGIFNDGPTGGNSQPTAVISALGTAEAIFIGPPSGQTETAGITIGGYTDGLDTASLLNRGTISSGSQNIDATNVTAIYLSGTQQFPTNLTDGILDSGTILAASDYDAHQTSATSAIGLLVNDYATVGGNGFAGLTITNENTNKPGSISASVAGSGNFGGTAIAVEITSNGDLPTIVNDGSIVASATTSNPNLKAPTGGLKAIAILDTSGNLSSVVNGSGASIEAFATTLSDNSQEALAIDVSSNTTTGFTLQNNGTIIGNINFSAATDNVTVQGLSLDKLATITSQKIYFDGIGGGSPDQLTIDENATVTSEIYAGSAGNPTNGELNIAINNGGTLNLLTAATEATINSNPGLTPGITLTAGSVALDSKSFLNIHYSQNFNIDIFPVPPVIINAQSVDLQQSQNPSQPNLVFTPDSFIVPPQGATSATFIVMQVPSAGDLVLEGNELSQINAYFQDHLSYLFDPLDSEVTLANNQTQLLLTIFPKTIGTDGCKTQADAINNQGNCNPAHIPLTGYAAQMFGFANQALQNDNLLGAAVLNGVTNNVNAQQVYENFAPDVSGAIRADAISLTDQATNIVAARQRELRQYANQEGDMTLWGQQFVQRLNQDSTSAGAGYTDTGFGFAAGVDEGDPVDGRYGVDFTFFSGDTREKQPRITKTTSEWYMLGAYTDWRGKGLFLDTQLNLGYTSLTGDRYQQLQVPNANGSLTLFQRDAHDTRPGEFASLGATTGAIFDENGTVFTPQVALDGLVMRQEAYNESGGGNGFDLHVASSYDQSFRGFAGLGVRQDFDFTDFLLQPQILAGYRYDFANGAESLKANFESVNPAQVFEVTGPKPDKGNIVASGGVSVSTGAWSLGLSFDYLKAGSGNTSESGSLTLLGRI